MAFVNLPADTPHQTRPGVSHRRLQPLECRTRIELGLLSDLLLSEVLIRVSVQNPHPRTNTSESLLEIAAVVHTFFDTSPRRHVSETS